MRQFSIPNALAVLACVALAACGDDEARLSDDEERPNIVLIVADDLGQEHVSAYGGRVPTPNIDRIAESGVRFTHGYAAAAVSGPSRAALLTGRYPQRFGYEFDNGPSRRDARERLGLPAHVPTIANDLQNSGYATFAVGKWHLGGVSEYYPVMRGFDDFYGVLSGKSAYISPRARNVRFAPTDDYPVQPAHNWFDGLFSGPRGTAVEDDGTYLTEALTDMAVNFIDRAQDRPFFLYLAYTAPATPLTVPERYYERFEQIFDESVRVHAAMIAAMDDGIGRVLDLLEERGIADNTIVVFVSDNGCDTEAAVCSCRPLRGGRVSFYEGGVRVPFMMRWPAVLPTGETYEERVSAIDIAPTLLAVADPVRALQAEFEGVNLLPYLTGEAGGAPHDALFWQAGLSRAVLSDDWKLWQLPDGRAMLFNLADDPNESENLIEQHADVARRLEGEMVAWGSENVPPLWPTRGEKFYSMCGTRLPLAE